jgi:two-component system chemotaxis sensor kinase CheA
VALDLAKYRTLFLEEATEHLSEMSTALLEIEKDLGAAGAIDVAFRMAHSIKSMAASLDYDSVTELAHALEDRMESLRSAGCVSGPEELRPLFHGLEGLEAMVGIVRETGEAPASQPELVERIRSTATDADSASASDPSAANASTADRPKKKSLG